jgi:predicted SprT family Zn-dependent metalloprotease
MKLINTTDLPNRFVRKMISWICKHPHVNLKMHSIDEIRVFERHSRICTGCAYFENVVTIGLGSKDVFRQYYRNPRKTRIRMLVQYLAHEFGHIQQFQLGRKTSERDANWIEAQVLKTFDEKANELVKKWQN